MYANARGIPRHDGIAAQLFNMAAEQGHEHAYKMMRYLDPSAERILPDCIQPVVENEGIDYADKPYFDIVQELAPQYSLDPALVMAIITVESAFDAQAVSHKNAQGLMQLIPETAERFHVKNTFDAVENIKGGMAYLRWLLAFLRVMSHLLSQHTMPEKVRWNGIKAYRLILKPKTTSKRYRPGTPKPHIPINRNLFTGTP